MLRAVDLSHHLLAGCLRPGDTAIDATAGNGRDTLFLAEATAPDGVVYGFDIQPAAVAATDRLLAAHGIDPARIHTICAGHECAASFLPTDVAGRVGALVFNLGYLPGGDRSVTTAADTTVAALGSLLPLLRAGGMAAITVYTGHPGGSGEAAAVRRFAADLPARDWLVTECTPLNAGSDPPFVIAIERQGPGIPPEGPAVTDDANAGHSRSGSGSLTSSGG